MVLFKFMFEILIKFYSITNVRHQQFEIVVLMLVIYSSYTYLHFMRIVIKSMYPSISACLLSALSSPLSTLSLPFWTACAKANCKLCSLCIISPCFAGTH